MVRRGSGDFMVIVGHFEICVIGAVVAVLLKNIFRHRKHLQVFCQLIPGCRFWFRGRRHLVVVWVWERGRDKNTAIIGVIYSL